MPTIFVLLLALAAMLWALAPARPQPIKVRRNVLQEDLLAYYINQGQRRH